MPQNVPHTEVPACSTNLLVSFGTSLVQVDLFPTRGASLPVPKPTVIVRNDSRELAPLVYAEAGTIRASSPWFFTKYSEFPGNRIFGSANICT